MSNTTDDLRIVEIKELISPETLISQLPVSEHAKKVVTEARQAIHNILCGQDKRLLVIVGPCSIHDPDAALDYAERLKAMCEPLADRLFVVMRVYFEKPRTTVGWKGLINDPDLDDSFKINKGLSTARSLLLNLLEKGLPVATEYLDLISPQYISDLISWGAIGARTTESQTHRELASGLSCPIGFKNATDGDIQVAIDAIKSASQPHHFLSVTKKGYSAIFKTAGNQDTHIILRGGKHPNYDMFSVEDATNLLTKAGLAPHLMIDASHANSRKSPARQLDVIRDIALQLSRGNKAILGVMIESNIIEGRQDIIKGSPLCYGQSITDACISIADTQLILNALAEAVGKR